jgi:hypothetical protein
MAWNARIDEVRRKTHRFLNAGSIKRLIAAVSDHMLTYEQDRPAGSQPASQDAKEHSLYVKHRPKTPQKMRVTPANENGNSMAAAGN